MIKNYLKIAWRNLLKSKAFSFINIAGLAAGLSCFILITLYVIDELSYDKYNEKASRIFRINGDIKFGGNTLNLAVTSDAMGPALKKDYPQVEQYVRLYASEGSKLIRKGNSFINEDYVVHADSTLFDVFTLPAIAGDTKTALNEPNTVVLTETAARKYFGTTDVVGKMLETKDRDKTLYKVTAVIKDMPANSHFHYDFFFSMKNVDYEWGNFLSNNFHTYIVLSEGTNYKEFEKNFPAVLAKYALPQIMVYMPTMKSMDDLKASGDKLEYTLMPLTDIHLHSNRFPELAANSNILYVYIFSAVALFILLIACINFMNLSTARSANRAKEVGIRKVLGTEKNHLIRQFLTESILMVFIGLGLALLIIWAVIPWFNTLSGKTISLLTLLSFPILPLLIVLPFLVGILAGIYPAFFLSSFKPITVLKGKINAGFRKSTLRSGLVVFQFATSIVLIIGTVVVYRQLNYIQTTQIGFNKDQLLIVDGTYALGQQKDAFKNDVLGFSGVKGATMSNFLPINPSSRNDNTFSKEAVMDAKNALSMQIWQVDPEYIPVMGMEMAKGRNFSRDFGGDSLSMIINESTASILGYEDPIGKKIYGSNGSDGTMNEVYTVVGVVKNFHYESLRDKIGPLCMILGNRNLNRAVFKVSTADMQPLIAKIEKRFKEMAPDMPFSYRFMDKGFENMYKDEQKIGRMGLSFAILAILIACLGLLGLVTYMAEQRTKEIGVRKVLGATVTDIVTMLSKDFLRLVLIAAVFAFPLAWWFMHSWLQDFAFRIDIGWWVFFLAGGIAFFIAVFTVSFQAIKAALSNPVKSLRSE